VSPPDPVSDHGLAIVPPVSSVCERGLPTSSTAGREVSPQTSYGLSGALILALAAWLAWTEGPPATVLLTILVCGTIGALVALLTRRLLLAVVLTVAQVVVVTTISSLKLKYMNMVLHAYDITYYLMSSTNIGFLIANYGRPVLAALLAIAAAALIAAFAWRVDPVRVQRRVAAFVLLAFAVGTAVAGLSVGERRHSLFQYHGMYVSSFYRSWAETIETLIRGQLMEASDKAPQLPPLTPVVSCTPAHEPPHIILIHHESAVQPSLFPSLDYDRRLDDFFRSDDGRAYRLGVETYGGASVLTEFSVMTGLSTYSFGGMRLFVQRLMTGKISETLPNILSKCGYRNVMFYPMLRSFTGAERFFKSVGISDLRDAKDQGAKRADERDRFYYDNALDDMERHFATSSAPLFTFIETMAGHWPYDVPYEPESAVPGGGPGTHPEMNEVLRRLWFSRLDYQHLMSELERRFPKQRFLIVRYGDHHPMATRVLFGYDEGTEAEDVLVARGSIGYQTFFAVNGVRFTPRFTSPDILDVPYLGTVLLEAAGLPLSDAYAGRKRLKLLCEGLWFDCPKRELILSFHRQLLDDGLVSAR
jgi:phosphoglycerol transferase MdoB-like AlkP superfamily enzyme